MPTMRQNRHRRHRFGAGDHDTWRGMRGWSNAQALNLNAALLLWKLAAGRATITMPRRTGRQYAGALMDAVITFSKTPAAYDFFNRRGR